MLNRALLLLLSFAAVFMFTSAAYAKKWDATPNSFKYWAVDKDCNIVF